MKKLLLTSTMTAFLLLFNACSKKSCPKPEVWGTGTWKLTETYDYDGTLLDPSDPLVDCTLNETIVLNNDGTGTRTLYHYSSGNCVPETQALEWVENTEKRILIIEANGIARKMTYENKDKFYYEFDPDYKWVYERE